MVREPDTTYFITGGAGFIGSNLADRLLDEGLRVVVYDDFSTGQREFLESASARDGFELIEGDLLDADALTRAMSGSDFVFHLAANADIRNVQREKAQERIQEVLQLFRSTYEDMPVSLAQCLTGD